MAEMKARYRASPDTVQDKQWTDIRVDSTGALVLSASSSGTVAVTSLTPGTSAANLGKAEDAAHASGDTGVMILGVRNDTNATLTSTDGDYSPIAVSTSGAVRVDFSNASPGVGANALGKAEDAVHTSGDVGVMSLAVRTDTPAALAGATGDYIPLTTNNLGALYVVPTSATAFATVGAAAHDAVISGAPNRIGGRAVTSNYTAVATGDTADLITTLVGAVIEKPFSIPEGDWTYAAAASGIVNTTTAVTVKAAAAAGLRNYITGLDFSWDALTNATEFAIRDGAAGTVIWRTKIPSGSAGRASVVFPTPLRGTAATLLEIVTLSASGAGGVFANLQGYVAP